MSSAGRSVDRVLDRLGLLLLALAVLFQAVYCLPEIALASVSVHDGTLHHALALRVLDAARTGENPIDPWVSFSSLGSPVWRSYQPLVHWVMAGAIALGAPVASSGAVVGGLTWLALVLHPVAFFAAARGLGVSRFGAGVAASICLAPVAVGNLDAFGAGYGAYVWRGSGLLTQLWAMPLFVLALAATAGALREQGSRARAAGLIGATALCHLIFGYAAALSAIALTLLACTPRRVARLALIGSAVVALCAFLLMPAMLDAPFVNHSVWEPAWKWTSHGAPTLVGALLRGELFDAGRLPVLSALLAGSALLALLRWPHDPRARALLGLAALWLVLAFGRATLGGLLPTALVNENIHLHRFVAVFQACGVLLVGLGADLALRLVAGRPRATVLVAAAFVLVLTPVHRERAQELRRNAALGLRHRLAMEAESSDRLAAFDAIDAAMARRPARLFAGFAARWGKEFLIGSAPAYQAVGARGFDATSHLWHSMSIPSDALLLVDDASEDQLRRFGVGYVLSDGDRAAPGRILGRSGRFTVRVLTDPSYFGVERDPLRCAPDAGPAERLECARRWLAVPPQVIGRIVSEARRGAEHDALVELDAPGSVVFRSSFHPGWRASLDGVDVPTRPVIPGFLAVDAPAGRHDLRLRYRPGPLKTALLLLGALAFAGFARAERRGGLDALERWAQERFDHAVGRWRAQSSKALGAAVAEPALLGALALTLLAVSPFVRSDLLLGHDALEYPTRLSELHQSVLAGTILPVWAPDLGAGFGQPMFGFVAPLLLLVAEPFHLAGLGLAASLNAAVVLLALLGAVGMFGLGRRVAGPSGGLVAVAAYAFGPYFQVELYVRAALMEFAGLAALPLALWLLLRCLERPGSGRVAAASVALAAVALSHNAVLLMAAPALVLFVLLIALALRSFPALVAGALAGLGGLALSAWFWLPAVTERVFTHAHRLLEGVTRWDWHFVGAGQLLASPWGFGLSVQGPDDGMSFAVGGVSLALAVAGLVAALRRSDPDPIPRTLVLVAVAVSALGVFFSHGASSPIWRASELLQYLQFPWRFLVLVTVSLPIAAAGAARIGRTHAAPALAVTALVGAGLLHLGPAGYETLDEARFTPSAIASVGLETTTFREFEPIWATASPRFQAERLDVVGGVATVRTTERAPTRQRFEVAAEGPARLQLATLYFPGWQVRVDGERVPLRWVDSGGLPQFDVPAGASVVEARLVATPVRRGARALSALTALALAGWVLRSRTRVSRPRIP